MESLGEKLKTARESKGLNFDQVSRETNIAGRYLEALEAEDFSGFPGEPYVTGFLRNYSEYLGLNVQEMLSLYRALKIQEQPVPVEQLLKSPSPLPRILITIAVVFAVLGAAGGGVFFFINRPRKTAVPAPVSRPASEFVMNTESLEKHLYPGDSVLVPLDTSQYKIELSSLGEALTITTPGGTVDLDLSQKAAVDLNGDGITELVITAADFVKNNSAAGAVLHFEMNNTLVFDSPLPVPEDGAGSGDPGVSGLAGATAIFSSPGAYPFTLQAVFQGYCMFRWEILFERDRRDRNEQYFQRSDELNIQAQNGIRIWVSNAQAVKLQVIGGGRTVPLELGSAGEVVVADIRWVRDDENRYRLVLVRLEAENSR
ncbi:MAG: helix-turn-helix domain-containing protein [Treponema sp.]|nr:helix-turn-helix domain-containing protein [Treponema sp.]